MQNSINTANIYGKSYKGAITGYNGGELTNCGYIRGNADYAAGYVNSDDGATIYETIASAPSVISILGTENYKEVSGNDYPILIWQTGNEKLDVVNGDGDGDGINDNAFRQLEDGSIVLAWQVVE